MAKDQIIIGLGALLAGILAGRYSSPEKVKVERVEVEKIVERTQEAKKEDKVQSRVESYRRDGTLRLVRVRVETQRESKLVTSKESDRQLDEKKVTENRRGVSVSALVGMPLDNLAKGVVYGASFQKQFLGPLILGAWAFTDLRFGLSVGIEL